MKSNKQQLRKQCLTRRQSLSKKQQQAFSAVIFNILQRYLDQHYAQGVQILCYRSLSDEVDTTAMFQMRSNDQYYAPVTQKNTAMHWLSCDAKTVWKTGALNVLEPIGGQCWQAGTIPSIVLCPVVGFDAAGSRIGMGKGCFDRWLAQNKQYFDSVIGLAFDCQRCPEIAVEAHDVPLDAVITEEGWMKCPNT
ncbi:MAG: 5-formyltetrahydrofolate cyclo-ligase [Mariprofundaceae bacterium]|nr:5-formyltetrahydrofolate cyclo-ligase [Mariprofundaceae bacterium]